MKVNVGRVLAFCGVVLMAWVLACALAAQANADLRFGLGGEDRALVAKTHETIPMEVLTGGADAGARRLARKAEIRAAESTVTAAGAHPDATAMFGLEVDDPDAGNPHPIGYLRDTSVSLPAGFLGNPEAVPACPRTQFVEFLTNRPTPESCTSDTQVGVVTFELAVSNATISVPLYRISRTASSPASFGFLAAGQPIVLNAEMRSESDYGIDMLSIDTPGWPYPVRSVVVTLWGVPWDPIHDNDRWDPEIADWGASVIGDPKPLIINPPVCSGSELATSIRMRSWQEPNRWVPDALEDPAQRQRYVSWSPPVSDCDRLARFEPRFDMRPGSSKATTPAGYDVKLEMPFNDDPAGTVAPYLRKVEVEFPEGISVSPSAANGLAGCTDAQAGFGTRSEANCPQASKIGEISIGTPLLPDRLNGGVYLGSPTDEQLLRVFIILKGFGVTVRVAGDVDTDPVTGQIKAVFDNNPQVPFTDLDLKFDSGELASLINPTQCGTHTIVAKLTSWNGDVAEQRSSFHISADGRGGPCPAQQPFDPWLSAGTTNPVSAEYSPFSLMFGRSDGGQDINSIDVEMPEGLTAKIAGVAVCATDQAMVGTCPEASKVGRVAVASGAGAKPFWVPAPGKDATAVYLAQGIGDAPYSLSIVVPAQAGPFDLGRVVVRSPINVDERTAQLSTTIAESRIYDRFGRLAQILPGKMPTILEGIPLKMKEARVIIDREEFMLNPTNCNAKQVGARIGSAQGASAKRAEHFQAADCASLGFAPRFGAKILDRGRRSTLRSWNPRTRFTVVPRPGAANIGGARVALPSSTILDQSNLDTTCTRAQMAAEDCPRGSIVGFARAWSPLLNRPVQGPVYLAANGGVRPLPDIAAVLDGEVRIVLVGEISTLRTRGKARLQNTFRVVPDAPVSRFVLTMRGGKNRGLLVNSTDLCRTNERGVAVFLGQNGKRHRMRPRLGLSFKGCKKVRRQVAKRRLARRKAAKRSAVLRVSKAARQSVSVSPAAGQVKGRG